MAYLDELGLKKCGELQGLLNTNFRELVCSFCFLFLRPLLRYKSQTTNHKPAQSDVLRRDIQESLQQALEDSAHNSLVNEKQLAKTTKEIEDAIRKVESSGSRRRRRRQMDDPEQVQQSVRSFAALTAELKALKSVNQGNILQEQVRLCEEVLFRYILLLW